MADDGDEKYEVLQKIGMSTSAPTPSGSRSFAFACAS